MFALFVIVQLIILVGMLGASVWGWRHLAPETRLRARSGATGIDWTISKSTALVSTPLIGLLVVLATVALRDSPNRDTVALLGAAVMTIFVASHWYSVKRAAR